MPKFAIEIEQEVRTLERAMVYVEADSPAHAAQVFRTTPESLDDVDWMYVGDMDSSGIDISSIVEIAKFPWD